jgi:hypothetical protein
LRRQCRFRLAIVAAARCEGAYDEARWNRPGTLPGSLS